MTQELIEQLRCDETPSGSTRSRLRSRCFPKTGRQAACTRHGAYTSQRGVAKYVRAATARGTRRREYFAAAVAARSRSRQAIMAAFLQIPLCQYRTSLCVFLFLFFLRCLRLSLSRRYLSFRASSLYRRPFPCFVSVASFQFSLGFSIPFFATRPRTLAGMRCNGVAVVVPH